MAFEWKNSKDIFKGPGIYHLTFAVAGRRPLLGELVRILDDGSFAPVRDARGERTDPQLLRGHWDADLFGHHTATVRLKPLGYEISEDLQHLSERHPGYQLCCKQVMDNHLHLVIWVDDDGGKSIRQWAHAFRLGITQLARSKGLWPITESPSHSVLSAESLCGAVAVCKPPVPQGESQWASGTRPYTNGSLSAAAATEGAGAAAGAGLVLEVPFIRTLAHKGQLRRMIDYTHNNPDNALMVREHPHWYHIRRSRVIAGLRFDTMGKERLLHKAGRRHIGRGNRTKSSDAGLALPLPFVEFGVAPRIVFAQRLDDRFDDWIDAALTDTHWANQPAHEVRFVENVVRITESDIVHERTEGRKQRIRNGRFHVFRSVFYRQMEHLRQWFWHLRGIWR